MVKQTKADTQNVVEKVETATKTELVETPEYQKAVETLEVKGFVRYTVSGTDRVYNTTRLAQLKADQKTAGITGVVE